jgi:Arc/MetJ-type ribon-helix-helix transcriptional regulator
MPEMEKLTINMTGVDLGEIELLVEQGFYSNRAEFIRLAIHDQLARHSDTVKDVATRQAFVIGAIVHDRRTLEATRTKKQQLAVRVVGFLSIDDDVTPKLARETIGSIKVLGIFKASAAVKEALADRIAA